MKMKMIQSFGKWREGSSDFYTAGRIYPLFGAGQFPDSILFLNDKGSIDEAASEKFILSSKHAYEQQQHDLNKFFLSNKEANACY